MVLNNNSRTALKLQFEEHHLTKGTFKPTLFVPDLQFFFSLAWAKITGLKVSLEHSLQQWTKT